MSYHAIMTVGYCCQLAIVAVVTTATSTLTQTHYYYIQRNHPTGGQLQPCSRQSQLPLVTAVCTPCSASPGQATPIKANTRLLGWHLVTSKPI